MQYVKLNDQGGIIAHGPPTLIVGDTTHYHPDDATYISQGWLRVVDTSIPDEPPGEGKIYGYHYEDDGDGNAVRVWSIGDKPDEPPPEPLPTYDQLVEAMDILTRRFG